jgi:hypothetical protein
MREPTDKEAAFVRETIESVLAKGGIGQWRGDMVNPYMLDIQVPVSVGRRKVEKTFNSLFHALGVLPADEVIAIGEGRDYCAAVENEDSETYSALFNVPFAKEFKEGDEEYQFTLKAINAAEETDAEEIESEMLELVAGIKAGRLKSKTPDGYLVLKGEFYDAIASGKKKVEYRDFSEYNLKRTIGLKTVRFNRGYVKNAPQMKWEVKKVMLLDAEDNACDPFNVPEGFWPTTIAIHLGKRIG